MKRYRVGILGASFGRLVHAPGFQRHPRYQLVAICGADPTKADRVAHEFGLPVGYSDWRRMLADLELDLVSIVTPVDLHHPMMLAALERGRHVLCEKPTALNRFQAAEMRDRAAALGLVAAIHHEFRYLPARRLALDQVRAGAIGTPRRGEIVGRYPIWWRPESRGPTWLSERHRGGGVLGALGSHHTDCLRLFFGEPITALASVRVSQPRRGPTDEGSESAIATADDACTVMYEFSGGATALVDLDAAVPYRWERFEIHGSEASLRWDETGQHLWRLEARREPEELSIPEAYRLDAAAGDPALLAPFGSLLDRLALALDGVAAMEPNFDDAVAVQSALDAARRSSASGSRVTVENPVP